MTSFLIGAALCVLAALALLLRPWFATATPVGAKRRVTAVGTALAAIALAAVIYLQLGKPVWNAAPVTNPAASAIVELRDAANDAPLDGKIWLRLGNAYLKAEQFSLAAHAFERGNRLENYQNVDGLTGLAESLALDGDATNDAQVESLFERALQLEPRSPKALLYTALRALHDGQLSIARERFVAMSGLGDAPAEVRAAIEKQIAAIDAQLKPVVVDPRTGIKLHVVIAGKLQAQVDAAVQQGAKLFVFVRGTGGGPPLAAKQLPASFPVDVDLSNADAMLAGHGIAPGQPLTVVARLSVSGNPALQSGDLSGELRITAGTKHRTDLVIAEQAP